MLIGDLRRQVVIDGFSHGKIFFHNGMAYKKMKDNRIGAFVATGFNITDIIDENPEYLRTTLDRDAFEIVVSQISETLDEIDMVALMYESGFKVESLVIVKPTEKVVACIPFPCMNNKIAMTLRSLKGKGIRDLISIFEVDGIRVYEYGENVTPFGTFDRLEILNLGQTASLILCKSIIEELTSRI